MGVTMIEIKIIADDDYVVRNISIPEESTNVEKAMLIASLRIVENSLLESMKDEWSVEE